MAIDLPGLRELGRAEPTKCRTCGYDRAGLVAGAKCPECGAGPMAGHTARFNATITALPLPDIRLVGWYAIAALGGWLIMMTGMLAALLGPDEPEIVATAQVLWILGAVAYCVGLGWLSKGKKWLEEGYPAPGWWVWAARTQWLWVAGAGVHLIATAGEISAAAAAVVAWRASLPPGTGVLGPAPVSPLPGWVEIMRTVGSWVVVGGFAGFVLACWVLAEFTAWASEDAASERFRYTWLLVMVGMLVGTPVWYAFQMGRGMGPFLVIAFLGPFVLLIAWKTVSPFYVAMRSVLWARSNARTAIETDLRRGANIARRIKEGQKRRAGKEKGAVTRAQGEVRAVQNVMPARGGEALPLEGEASGEL